MKKITLILMALSLQVFLISCDNLFNTDEKPNELLGSINVPISKVGNEFHIGVTIGNEYIPTNEECTVQKNDNGIITLKFKMNIKDSSPKLKQMLDLIPVQLADNNGQIETEFKMKVTSEGIQDYFNKDNKAHTLVKYNCKVGDKYELTKSNGMTITRTVTAISTENDFDYGLMQIKTITIEQDSRIPGVKKIVFKANHKFGLVHVSFEMEDGTKAGTYVYTKGY